MLHCSKTTVDTAIKNLEREGVISCERTKGIGTIYRLNITPTVPKYGTPKEESVPETGTVEAKGVPKNGTTVPISDPTVPKSGTKEYKEEKKEENKSKRFCKPTLPQVQKYLCEEKKLPLDEAQAFLNYHESRGWVVGKSPMKDWEAACRTWVLNYHKFKNNGNFQKNQLRPPGAEPAREFEQQGDNPYVGRLR